MRKLPIARVQGGLDAGRPRAGRNCRKARRDPEPDSGLDPGAAKRRGVLSRPRDHTRRDRRVCPGGLPTSRPENARRSCFLERTGEGLGASTPMILWRCGISRRPTHRPCARQQMEKPERVSPHRSTVGFQVGIPPGAAVRVRPRVEMAGGRVFRGERFCFRPEAAAGYREERPTKTSQPERRKPS